MIRPVCEHTGHDSFADLILEDLIKEGLSGDELLTKFRERQAELHIAIENGIAESGEAARKCRADNDETEDLFGEINRNSSLPDDRRSITFRKNQFLVGQALPRQ
ncbi:hypothetical protein QJQ58_22770 [Paenibacillus dendritiformis]|uniref:hypothetical protein n=1 Tax=Paenibacillus dendritiformis TaxID=130049 RepID=UPI00248B3476|nr:hypothetical protein [Paenibacillus dendritiformis]WGU93332.1 hypothetical protein QJQ58_22770 [Paenibacillus dendritiformis]